MYWITEFSIDFKKSLIFISNIFYCKSKNNGEADSMDSTIFKRVQQNSCNTSLKFGVNEVTHNLSTREMAEKQISDR